MPTLTNAPAAERPEGSGGTHWAQAATRLKPWPLSALPKGAAGVRVQVRTDGVNIRWTPMGSISSGGEGPLQPLPTVELPDTVPPEVVEAWRLLSSEPADALRTIRRKLDEVGDVARLAAMQAACLNIASQPGLFGLEATPDALAPLLKEFYP